MNLIDFNKAQVKIMEFEQDLKIMSYENENLKTRLDHKLSIGPKDIIDEKIYSTAVSTEKIFTNTLKKLLKNLRNFKIFLDSKFHQI